jgi:hypothetical protein
MTILLLSLSISTAHAGKLAAGWRGRPFGPSDTIATAPGDSCAPSPEAGVRWRCSELVGGAPVIVSYMVEEDTFASVLISCDGFSACSVVVETLGAAWGRPFSTESYGMLPDRFWQDGGSIGSWSYNEFSKEGYAVAADTGLLGKVKAAKAARARSAADDL